jgi:hypothetical protein
MIFERLRALEPRYTFAGGPENFPPGGTVASEWVWRIAHDQFVGGLLKYPPVAEFLEAIWRGSLATRSAAAWDFRIALLEALNKRRQIERSRAAYREVLQRRGFIGTTEADEDRFWRPKEATLHEDPPALRIGQPQPPVEGWKRASRKPGARGKRSQQREQELWLVIQLLRDDEQLETFAAFGAKAPVVSALACRFAVSEKTVYRDLAHVLVDHWHEMGYRTPLMLALEHGDPEGADRARRLARAVEERVRKELEKAF